jgi:hypothetical protein
MFSVQGFGVGIDEQFIGVKAVAGAVHIGLKPVDGTGEPVLVLRPVWAPGAKAVMLSQADAFDEDAPDVVKAVQGEGFGRLVGFGVVKEQ